MGNHTDTITKLRDLKQHKGPSRNLRDNHAQAMSKKGLQKRISTHRAWLLLLLTLGLYVVATSVSKTCFPNSLPDQTLLTLKSVPEKEVKEDDFGVKHRLVNASAVCRDFVSHSAMSWWVDNIDHIFSSSRLWRDKNYHLHDKTAEVLKLMSSRLALSHRSFPRDWEKINQITRKAYKRYIYIQQSKQSASGDKVEEPPLIKILVMGGSVTAGINCYTGVSRSDIMACAWPARLQRLINELAGGKLVDVRNLAISGSNTKTGQAVLEYELVPPEDRNPDILINAYSTNDMHVMTVQEAADGNQTLREKVFEMAQNFIRTVLKPSCLHERPLLLWLDDYLGNEQRELLKTTELSQSIQVLANYYGFGFVSYADTVRDLVYGETKEGLLSPSRWYNERGKMQREIHPGQGMHMAVSWIFLYYFIHLATLSCSLEAWNVLGYEKTLQYNDSNVPGLPTKLIGVNPLLSRSRPRPEGLPPYLDANLRLDDVSAQWQRSARQQTSVCSTNGVSKCVFSWVSGIDRDPTRSNADAILAYFKPYLKQFDGWELIDETGRGDKYGWQPIDRTKNPAKVGPFRLEVPLRRHISQVTLFYLKSYGEKWKDSEVSVRIEANQDEKWELVGERTFSGFHEKKTSEMYTDSITLLSPVKDKIAFNLQRTSGFSFKLMGIAFCGSAPE